MEKNTDDLYSQILRRLSEMEVEQTFSSKEDSFGNYYNESSKSLNEFDNAEIKNENIEMGFKNDSSKDKMIQDFLNEQEYYTEEDDFEERKQKRKNKLEENELNNIDYDLENNKKEKKNKKNKKNKAFEEVDNKDAKKTRKLLKFMVLIQFTLLSILLYLLYAKMCDSNLPLPFLPNNNIEIEEVLEEDIDNENEDTVKEDDKNEGTESEDND